MLNWECIEGKNLVLLKIVSYEFICWVIKVDTIKSRKIMQE